MAYSLIPTASESLATSQPLIQANFSYLQTVINPTVLAEEHVACFVGEIKLYGGASTNIPKGWLNCDGTAYSRTNASYAGLFSVIGTTYGVGDGANTFNVPSFCNVFVRGVATSPGSTGGNDSAAISDHTLTTAEMPAHTHSINTGSTVAIGAYNLRADTLVAGYPTESAGGGGAHNHGNVDTIPKYGTAIYLIKR